MDVPLSNEDIHQALKSENGFQGVYSYDRLPNLKQGQFCVVNTDNILPVWDRAEGGHHWLTVCREKDHVLVFDSFGRSLEQMEQNYTEPNSSVSKGGSRPVVENTHLCPNMVVCHIVCIRYTKYGNDTVFVSYGKCYSVYYDVTVCSTMLQCVVRCVTPVTMVLLRWKPSQTLFLFIPVTLTPGLTLLPPPNPYLFPLP